MDFHRSRRVLQVAGGVALAGVIAVVALEGAAAMWTTFAVGLTIFVTTFFAPLGSLGTEKMLGSLEIDRSLPVPTRTLAAARLIAAALRTLPLLLLLVSIAVLVARRTATVDALQLAFAVLALQMLYWSGLWVAYGLLARFNFQKLVWLPAALWILTVLAPDALWKFLERVIVERVTSLAAQAMTDASLLPVLGVAILGFAAVCFGVALLLLTDALRRFQANPMAMQGPMEKVPREELTPVGRGVMIAVLRLRLRLAAPQLRREMIFVAAMVAILFAERLGVSGLSALPDISRSYLPILAFLMPGSMGIQMMLARQLGTIEGLQQLPAPRRDVALGHLLTVGLLAVPAIVIWSVARAFEGDVLDATRLFRMWVTIGAGAFLIASLILWGTLRRILILAGIALGVPLALYYGGGRLLPLLGVDVTGPLVALTRYWVAEESWLKPSLMIAGAVVAIVVALAMFTQGLRTYQSRSR